jgi:hypothetical protein
VLLPTFRGEWRWETHLGAACEPGLVLRQAGPRGVASRVLSRSAAAAATGSRPARGPGQARATATQSPAVKKLPDRAWRTFLVAGVLVGLSACGQKAATTVEPLTIEALIEVIENSPTEATFVKLGTPADTEFDIAESTSLLVRRDGANFTFEEAGLKEDEKDYGVYFDDEFYATVPGDAGNTKWVRVVDNETPRPDPADVAESYFTEVIYTLTSEVTSGLTFDTVADLLDGVDLAWSDFAIVNSSCTSSVCTYDLLTEKDSAAIERTDTGISVTTESIAGRQRLTSLTMHGWGETTLELGYDPQTILAPSEYTDISAEVWGAGATSEEELRTVVAEAEAYLRTAAQRAKEIGTPVTSRKFWETYLPGNAPEGVSLWADTIDTPNGIRELVGPDFPYADIASDLGDTIGRISFQKNTVYVCMDFEKNAILPYHC